MVDQSDKWSTSDEGDSSESKIIHSGLDLNHDNIRKNYLMSRGSSMIKNWPVDDQVAHLAEITSRRHGAAVHLRLVDQISLNSILFGLISNAVITKDK